MIDVSEDKQKDKWTEKTDNFLSIHNKVLYFLKVICSFFDYNM